jgi:hypothetical protein
LKHCNVKLYKPPVANGPYDCEPLTLLESTDPFGAVTTELSELLQLHATVAELPGLVDIGFTLIVPDGGVENALAPQLATAPLPPLHVHDHGPVPETADGLPPLQRPEDGAEENVPPFDEPQAFGEAPLVAVTVTDLSIGAPA